MVETFLADLHIHSCLSPCGSLEMSPSRIVNEALNKGIKILGLTDHNSAANTPPFESLCLKHGITPISGMEITTSEELHALVLFATSREAVAMEQDLSGRFSSFPNDPEAMGDQIIVDEQENILGEKPFHLVAATDIPLEELVVLTHDHGGLIIPAHIDRPYFSVSSQLGFLPFEPFDAVEITSDPCPVETRNLFTLTDSDAHYPEDIGKRTTLLPLESRDFSCLKDFLHRHIEEN